MESDRSPSDEPSPRQTYWAVAEPPAQPPPAGTRYAPIRVRFGAWFVDIVVFLVVAGVLLWPIAADFFGAMIDALPDRVRPGQTYLPEVQAAMGEAFANAIPAGLRASAIIQVVSLVYLAGSWLAFGMSPGMALFGIRIAREEDGGRPGVGRVIVRYAGYLLSAIPFLFGFAWALLDKRNQAWHDKLAGTIVVYGTTPTPTGVAESGRRRPSIGAIADEAWTLLARSPGELVAAIGLVLVPGLIILIPVVAIYLVLGQDQTVAGFRSVRELFNLAGDPAAYQRYNLRIFAATAPTIWLSALIGLVGSIVGAFVLGATAAAVNDAGHVEPPDTVTRGVRDRLGALVTLGLAGGAFSGVSALAIGLPALAIASSPTADPRSVAYLGAFAAVAYLVIAPASLYFGSIWALAIVCSVRERLGASDSLRRAWRLSRHRMRWLAGAIFMTTLSVVIVVGLVGLLPIGLLSESYLQGQRLPITLSIILIGLAALVTAPLVSLAFVQTYRAARDDLD